MFELYTLCATLLLGFQAVQRCMEEQESLVEAELTNLQLEGLVHYFGMDYAETPESLVEGIDALVRLQRS
jgi:hypothetical protein